jgi:hypothetical protein
MAFAYSGTYNAVVARGWESKSVEDQVDSAQRESSSVKPAQSSAEKLAVEREREMINLARTNVQRQLEVTESERHRDQLNRALADLDKKLADFEKKQK